MNAIDTFARVSAARKVLAAVRTASEPAVTPPPASRGADDASSLISGSSLKVRLAGPHAESMQLSETAATIDAADDALATAHGALDVARNLIGDPDQEIDAALASVQAATLRVRARGIPILHEGATLRAGASTLDIRPVSIDDLGAVIDNGRSLRLSDLRTGGALDARANPVAARRSADAALSELTALRSDLRTFSQNAVTPAQRSGLAAFNAVADASPVTPADPGAIRANLLSNAQSARTALAGSPPEGVLRLLGS